MGPCTKWVETSVSCDVEPWGGTRRSSRAARGTLPPIPLKKTRDTELADPLTLAT